MKDHTVGWWGPRIVPSVRYDQRQYLESGIHSKLRLVQPPGMKYAIANKGTRDFSGCLDHFRNASECESMHPYNSWCRVYLLLTRLPGTI